MVLDVRDLNPHSLGEAAKFFEEYGYIRLSGLEDVIAPAFEDSIAKAIGISRLDLQPLLHPQSGAEIFDRNIRQRLSRIGTPPQLAETLLPQFSPLLIALIGPIVHVSSTYHAQFKGGPIAEAAKDIASYHNETAADYMEVHGAYRNHQDFTGASLPTSPSGVTLWVALNDCPESTLRLFPGSHRLGIFCHKMWKSDDPRLANLADPLELPARRGTGVVFNSLLFHGTGRIGSLRRVSCDLRFYPLCGFLPSDAHLLSTDPVGVIRQLRTRAVGPTTLSPLLEQLAFLGEDATIAEPPRRSVLNWVRYVDHLMQGRPDAALPFLSRFINTDLLEDPETVFTHKFHNREIHRERLDSVRERAQAGVSRATHR